MKVMTDREQKGEQCSNIDHFSGGMCEQTARNKQYSIIDHFPILSLSKDEAYSLKHDDAKDGFGQEVIDTLIQVSFQNSLLSFLPHQLPKWARKTNLLKGLKEE